MPYPNEHAARVRDPGDFTPGSFRSKTLPKSEGGKGGVRMIIGKLKGEDSTTVQAYRFPIDLYTAEEAKAWLKTNKVKYISFEPAAEKEKKKESISLDEVTRQVRDAWRSKFAPTQSGVSSIDAPWPRDVLDDQVIVEMGEGLLSYPYTINADGEVEFGEPVKVKVVYQQEATYLEAVVEPHQQQTEGAQFEGREWDVTIIGARSPDDVVTVGEREFIRSKNGRLYAVDALSESAPLWDGVKVYDNHLTDEEFAERAGMRSVAREWIGSITSPRWDETARQLRGVLKVVEESVAHKLKNAWDAGILDTIGLSIDTLTIQGQEAVVEGQQMPTVEGFQKIVSVDLVAEPAAGGGFNRLIAAQTLEREETTEMTPEEIAELVKKTVAEALAAQQSTEAENPPEEEEEPQAGAGELPPAAVPSTGGAAVPAEAQIQERMRKLECQLTLRDRLDAAKLSAPMHGMLEGLFANKVFEVADLDAAIKRAKEAEAAHDPSGRVVGAGGQRGNIQVGMDEKAVAEVEFLRLLSGNTAFRELEHVKADYVQERVPESYRGWVKAGRPNYGTRRISEWVYHLLKGDPMTDQRAYEAVTTAGMTSIVKNALNVMLAADYAQRQLWWEPLVRTEEVDTIDQATLVRVYGLNTLAVVSEGDAYTELPWSDEEETASFVKKGNFVGITLETLLSDKVNVVRSLPGRLATAWYNTLSALVSGVFTVNTNAGPVLADSGALFNATAVASAGGHANLLTGGLSFTTFGAARTAMRKQTDQLLGAGQKLLIEPRFLLVPADLETIALQIRNSEKIPGSANNDINPFYNKCDIVVVPNWTDANDWALVADPAEFPAIWLIFLRGRRVPELFTAGDEASGAMFTNDVLRYKVRMLTWRFSASYDCAPVNDFRPLHKSNVA